MTAPVAVTGEPRRVGRSIAAVVAGFLTVFILSLVTDQILHVLKVYPPWGQPMFEPGLNALALSYRIVFTILGGSITARMAPRNPMRHAIILGIIGTAFGAIGVVATMPMKMGPMWYPVLLAVTALPSCWLGGRLVARTVD